MENPEPYNSIYDFIQKDILKKYPCLTSCYQDNFDEEGNPQIQYYIRYAADLSIKQWKKLFKHILHDIKEFCTKSGIIHDENLDIDIILTIDGDWNGK